MESSESQEKLISIFKQYYLPIFFGLGGVVLLLYGLIQSVIPQKSGEVVFESHAEVATGSAELVTVDVAGAVESPGVYDLPADSRVQDALIAAGGMSTEADRVMIARSLNLASKIIDGGKIYIPFEGETSTTTSFNQGSNTQSVRQTVLGTAQSGLININSASESELDTLPGIGPVTAGKIIAGRPYEKIEDLLSKKVVGNGTFEKIRDQIQAY